MADLARILTPSCTAIDVDVHSRKRALEWISERLASENDGLDAREIFLALQARERLGSTGLGEGIAIPHCRTGHPRIAGVFIRLRNPIEYDAPDGQPVDLLFGLVVPEQESSEHLKVLAALSRAFSDSTVAAALRSATSASDLRDVLLAGCGTAGD